MADQITFELIGGGGFMVDLTRWVGRLRDEVSAAAVTRGHRIETRVSAKYPIGPRRQLFKGSQTEYVGGNLRAGLHVSIFRRDSYAVQVLVRNAAEHSHLFEWGSRERTNTKASGPGKGQTTSRNVYIPNVGWRRTANRGAMPARPTMIPIVIEERAAFERDVRAIMSSPEPAIGPGRPDLVITGN